MSNVVTYKNNNYQCFCQIRLDNGERVLISIASTPTPSVKVLKLGFFLGMWPTQTIWEYNTTKAGGYDAYAQKMMKMFQDPLALEPMHPLDILRDRLLRCRSVSEVRDSMLEAERNISECRNMDRSFGLPGEEKLLVKVFAISVLIFTAAGPIIGGLGWFFHISALYWVGVFFCVVTLYLNGVSGAMISPLAPLIFVVIGIMVFGGPWYYGASVGLLVWTAIEAASNLIGSIKIIKM